jgi:hypothetical protein
MMFRVCYFQQYPPTVSHIHMLLVQQEGLFSLPYCAQKEKPAASDQLLSFCSI